MNANRNKILVAVDGSDHALKAVKYVSKTFSFQKPQVVLFHVYSKLTEYYKDLESKPEFDHKMIEEIKAVELRQEAVIQEFMKKAKQILGDAGFPSDAIEEKTHVEEKGIARDIINEAKSEYSAVVIGRKGISDLEKLVLGGVSTKLLEKIDFAPLLVVGEDSKPGKILLGLDGSEGAMKAVDYVGPIIAGSGLDVTIVHVIRGGESLKSGYHLLAPSNEYIEEAKEEISANFDKARRHLIEFGVEPNQISKKIITGVYSRAVAIFEEAKDGGYGTIVVGRRGLSKVREFFIGRVSNKLIQLAKGHAVWVVN